MKLTVVLFNVDVADDFNGGTIATATFIKGKTEIITKI